VAKAYAAGAVSFSQATSFNLDEYVGLGADHPCSYHQFMAQELFNRTDFDPSRTFLPKGDAPDPEAEAARYEALIAAHGPIDLQLLGLGANGHIGFNEPTSSLGSRTRIKTLTKATRDANMRFFEDDQTPPKYAITVGIQTILEARKIVLLATGSRKAEAVAAMIEGPLSAACPGSALQLHPHATIILDRAASAHLQMREYYSLVHPGGEDTL